MILYHKLCGQNLLSPLNLSNPLLIGIMKLFTISIAVALSITAAAPTATLKERISSVQGFDISNYQKKICTSTPCPTDAVDIPGAYKSGARFVIIRVRSYPPAHHYYPTFFLLVVPR
jgi:hypothetical protein